MIKIGVQKRENLSGGPANFFQRLIDEINENKYAKIVGTKNLLQDISLYSSVANRINFKQHVVRIDGIYFDKKEHSGNNETLNKRIFKTIVICSQHKEYNLYGMLKCSMTVGHLEPHRAVYNVFFCVNLP